MIRNQIFFAMYSGVDEQMASKCNIIPFFSDLVKLGLHEVVLLH